MKKESYEKMMRRKAFNEEFGFTGVYCGNYSEYRKGSNKSGSEAIKEEKKRPEYKGYKTRIVHEEQGVSLYIEKRYFKDEAKNNLEKKINSYNDRKRALYEKYQNSLEELNKEQEENIKRYDEIVEELRNS